MSCWSYYHDLFLRPIFIYGYDRTLSWRDIILPFLGTHEAYVMKPPTCPVSQLCQNAVAGLVRPRNVMLVWNWCCVCCFVYAPYAFNFILLIYPPQSGRSPFLRAVFCFPRRMKRTWSSPQHHLPDLEDAWVVRSSTETPPWVQRRTARPVAMPPGQPPLPCQGWAWRAARRGWTTLGCGRVLRTRARQGTV